MTSSPAEVVLVTGPEHFGPQLDAAKTLSTNHAGDP